ncbi:MAG TPA: periplasmic heavy metal sensor [Caulobacteraceae bacterium]|nr:periplasmic heavy metal sensor [Caulobacteraceae bacterium]
MSSRTGRTLLAASLVLNLFLLGAGIGGAVMFDRFKEREHARRAPALHAAMSDLPPERQEALRAVVRQAALAARPDFREARQARRRAAELAAAPSFDPAGVRAELARARDAELRGRLKLENGLIGAMQDLDASGRAAIAPALARSPGKARRGEPRR